MSVLCLEANILFVNILAIVYETFDVNISSIVFTPFLFHQSLRHFFVFVGLLIASAEKILFMKVIFKAC